MPVLSVIATWQQRPVQTLEFNLISSKKQIFNEHPVAREKRVDWREGRL